MRKREKTRRPDRFRDVGQAYARTPPGFAGIPFSSFPLALALTLAYPLHYSHK